MFAYLIVQNFYHQNNHHPIIFYNLIISPIVHTLVVDQVSNPVIRF